MKIGNETLWNLNILSFGSYINLNNINLKTSEIIGTGEINLGEQLNSGDISISGIFDIYVDSNLPIVVIGSAEVPSEWINATIGYLSQAEKMYKFKVIVEEGSQVRFFNEN